MSLRDFCEPGDTYVDLVNGTRELITEEDVLATQIANKETLEALEEIARRLTDDAYWGLL